MMEGLKITKIELTDAACARILETAIQAGHTYGIGYWAEVRKIDTVAHGRYSALHIIEHEAQPRKRRIRVVDYATIRRGVAKMLRDESECYDAGRLLKDDLDGPLSDVIIQMATFGSVEYA